MRDLKEMGGIVGKPGDYTREKPFKWIGKEDLF